MLNSKELRKPTRFIKINMTDTQEVPIAGGSSPVKPEGVHVVVPPRLEAGEAPTARESGYARAARLRTAGGLAIAATAINSANDDEPYEDVGFGD
jgi:hypothetical protein